MRWVSAGLSAVLGLGLLVLGVPRTIASWEAVPADRTIDKLGSINAPSAVELSRGIDALGRSVGMVAASRRLVDLGTLEFEQAQRMFSVTPERKPLLEASERHLLAALANNPVDGLAWYRLAQTRQARGAPPREIAIALLQSLDMSPNMRWLSVVRAQGIFTYASALQEEEIGAVRGHLRTIWKAAPTLRVPLLRVALGAQNVQLLSSALRVDTEANAEFEKLMNSPAGR